MYPQATAAKACGGVPVLEPAHEAIPLLDAAMILFQVVVYVAVGPVQYLVPEDLPNRAWVDVVAISGDPVGYQAGHRPRGAEKRLGCREVPCVAETHIYQIPVPINRTVEITPLSLHVDVCLVDVPTASHSTPALLA